MTHIELCKRWRALNPERVKENWKRWYASNREAVCLRVKQKRDADLQAHRAYDKQWVRENPKKVLNKRLKYRHGLTLEEYGAMLQSQDGRCAVCGTVPAAKRLHVDHDHQTGVIRGLLCLSCNRGLGLFRDHPYSMRRAAAYIEAAS